MAGEKTEKATPKKRRDARKEGQVVKSIELINVFSFIAVLFVLRSFSVDASHRLQSYFRQALLVDSASIRVDIGGLTEVFAAVTAPFLLASLVVGVLLNYLQVGFLFTPKAVAPKLSKVSPKEGFQRLFSKKTFFTSIKTLIKLTVIGVLGYLSIKPLLVTTAMLVDTSIAVGMQQGLDAAVGISTKIAIALLANAVIDYLFEWFDHEKKIRMTKQEIKDEYKKTEGDPLIKSNIRNKQLQMARMRMMQAVPTADVIITNPTHYAVALKYETGKAKAPKVVAKGQNLIAEKIKAIASENDVIIVENKPLARTLYRRVEIDEMIPLDLFQAVAEVLAYVYRVKNKIMQ